MRFALCRWAFLLGVIVPNWSGDAAEPSRAEQLVQIERAVSAGTAFLVMQQDPDGAWRSKTYGLLKDGTSLTPLAAWALAHDDGAGHAARDRALQMMSTWPVRDGERRRLGSELQYSVYAAGLCLPLLHHAKVENAPAQIAAWTERILALQLNDDNGWSTDDAQYGGWVYSHEPPRKPERGIPLSPLDEPNLSATVFALEGLAAGDPDGRSTAAACQAALIFVSRCQNLLSADPSDRSSDDAKFNDGGFHFMQHDPVRNKPGIAGIDSHGVTRFVSYGSATADGLRALVLCGVGPKDPRVVAAWQWLLTNFEDGVHPGAYPHERSSLKPSLDYYYAASVARAFQLVPIPDDEPLGRGEWARRLSQRLISRQRDDGSWSNAAVDVRENDPLVATPLALQSLHICRDELRRTATRNP